MEFSQFIRDEGIHIIPISNDAQLKYGCNVLNLGNSRIISVHPASARQIAKSPHFHGDLQVGRGRGVGGLASCVQGQMCRVGCRVRGVG